MNKKNKLALAIMGVYVVTLIIGVIFQLSVLTLLSTAIAIITAIWIQQTKGQKIDERETFIVERSASMSYQLLVTTLIFGALTNDFIGFENYVSLSDIFQILIGLGFMTFVSMYVHYSEKFE